MVPKTIGPPGQLVPKHLVPMDKWSPRQLVPLDKQSPNNWSPWTIGPQNLLLVSKSSLEHFFQFFDIGWSTLDIIMDDFKPISKKIYLRFGEINQSLLFVFVQKHFFYFYFELEMVYLGRK